MMTYKEQVEFLWEGSSGSFSREDIESFTENVFVEVLCADIARAKWIGKFKESHRDLTISESGALLMFFDDVDRLPHNQVARWESDVSVGLEIEDVIWDGSGKYSPYELIGNTTNIDTLQLREIESIPEINHIALVTLNIERVVDSIRDE